ncbi:hypothetical protein GWC95_13455 [Sediminibacterium roseum]|uniref:Uncharacterized protein n=1 Tax=Sediminibacterium roseum TaxID=1978412 RepID=A0ABW9ZV95_9BACT|nr:hypothetical protein [Sediminibacterium roseum]NCI50934.1 hypothetical protein [Sediminibacterium roseum]
MADFVKQMCSTPTAMSPLGDIAETKKIDTCGTPTAELPLGDVCGYVQIFFIFKDRVGEKNAYSVENKNIKLSNSMIMKKKILSGILLVAVITVVSFWAKSQLNSSNDTLSFSEFNISPTGTGFTAFNTALLGESGFLSRFGAPPAGVNADYSDEDEANMSHYVYKGAEAWFLNDKLQALVISSSDFTLYFSNGSSLVVGDNISAVNATFPNSWTARTGNQVYVNLQNSSGPVDATLLFAYDIATGVITSISVQ